MSKTTECRKTVSIIRSAAQNAAATWANIAIKVDFQPTSCIVRFVSVKDNSAYEPMYIMTNLSRDPLCNVTDSGLGTTPNSIFLITSPVNNTYTFSVYDANGIHVAGNAAGVFFSIQLEFIKK